MADNGNGDGDNADEDIIAAAEEVINNASERVRKELDDERTGTISVSISGSRHIIDGTVRDIRPYTIGMGFPYNRPQALLQAIALIGGNVTTSNLYDVIAKSFESDGVLKIGIRDEDGTASEISLGFTDDGDGAATSDDRDTQVSSAVTLLTSEATNLIKHLAAEMLRVAMENGDDGDGGDDDE